MSQPCVLAIDQGTTSSRALVFDAEVSVVYVAQQEFPQRYPADGWVEHDPEAIWKSVLEVAREAFAAAEARGLHVAAIGLTNQRETALAWDRGSGRPVHNAVVWQDRRTAEVCRDLKLEGREEAFRARTGLLLDPYFSCTKFQWLLRHVDRCASRAAAGQLAFGTVDSFLIHRLTGGRRHVTDVTNASRTGLFNIHSLEWDAELCAWFGVPESVLPEVLPCSGSFGVTDRRWFGREIPILGVAGDQQAAAIGQGCFEARDAKSTYGTGCFILANTGGQPVVSRHRLLTTLAWQLDGSVSYALEGSIFVAGAAVQWLRDGLGVIGHAADTEGMARGLPGNAGVYLVPAFTGLGAPHWDPDARGALFGLTRSTGPRELARAALESAAYQTCDLVDAMAEDGVVLDALRVDGGMVANDWMVQFLADMLGRPVERPDMAETSALGAALLAGWPAGVYPRPEEAASKIRRTDRFEPALAGAERDRLRAEWHRAVSRVLSTPG
jgi:glycerol kinase